MKISQPLDNPVAISNNAASASAKNGSAAASLAKASGAEGAKTAGVAVTMSKMARSLEATGASETPQIDTAKVNAVRAAIAQGTYKVNPEAIADKLLSNAQEMLTRSRA